MKKRALLLSILVVLAIIVVTFSVTYAYLSVSSTQSNSNTMQSACFKTTFSDNNSIIKTSYPMSDVKGLQSNPYILSFSNCADVSYQVALNIKSSTNTIILDYIRYSLDGINVHMLSDASKINIDGISDSATIASYLIDKGFLNASINKTINLRVWLGEEAGNEVMNQKFEAEVVVYTVKKEEVSGFKTAKLTNMLTDTSFEELNSKWSTGTSDSTHYKYGNRSLKLVGSTSSLEIVTQNNNGNILLNSSHIYYGRYEVYHEGATGSAGIYWPVAEPPLFESRPLGSANSWNIVSGVNNRSSFTTGSYPLRLDFNNNRTASTVWYDGVVLVDLTASFGVGHEPSLEWCDTNIPYFEGTKSIIY